MRISKTHPLNSKLVEPQKYYFVHSYFVEKQGGFKSLATCTHGIEFEAILQHDNLMGVQFHPEKSHKIWYGYL